MGNRTISIPNLRNFKAREDEPLTIDLGQTFEGELISWMKKDPNSPYYRDFEIIDNRYLHLTKAKAVDIKDGGNIVAPIVGKWYFDVKQIVDDDPESIRAVYRGIITFQEKITNTLNYGL